MENRVAEPTSRRHFLTLLWRGIAALTVGNLGYQSLRYVTSREKASAAGVEVTVGAVEDFARDSVTPFPTERFFLVRFADGGFLALYTKCTHLACVVNWEGKEARFVCPCHGSQFDREGEVLNPPAPRPLDRFAIRFDRGRVIVDTAKRIERDQIAADDVAYAPEE